MATPAASEALGRIGPAAADAVPQLIIALRNEDAGARAAASEDLGKIGAAAVDAVPQLLMVLKDEDARVRAAASEALGYIGPAAADAVPQLTIALKDEDARVQDAASEALGKMGSAPADAVNQLVIALQDEDARVRAAASKVLSKIGPSARDVAIRLCNAPAGVGGTLGKIVIFFKTPLELPGADVHDPGCDVESPASLREEDVADRLAQVEGVTSLDPIVAKAVVHSIWCCQRKDVISTALKVLPESMKMLELSAFQQRWLVQRALQMWPHEAVDCKLQILLDCRWGHTYPTEPAISEAGSNELPGLGPVDTDETLSYQRDESLACSSGHGVPPTRFACPWSQSSVASA